LTLPVAVILNRFLAEDFVFILGILLLLLDPGALYQKALLRDRVSGPQQGAGTFVVDMRHRRRTVPQAF
jgi:hypothetical protein